MRIIESLFSFDSEMPIYIENEIIFSKHLINISQFMDTFRRESENMARISRVRKQEFLQIKETAIRKSYYRTALYIRVSILDGGRQGSDTVKTQELFLRKFIEEKPEFLLTYIYTDNGESGVNFQRSSFKQMIENIKKEKGRRRRGSTL